MLGAGDSIPEAQVWTAPRDGPTWLEHVLAGEPALLAFYLWDWSPT